MRLWDLDNPDAWCDPNSCSTIEIDEKEFILDFSTGQQLITIGLPGSPGPAGPQGPVGPPGTGGGMVAVVVATESIPLGQVYTVANPMADIDLTLPLISTVLVGGFAIPYTISNVTLFTLTVLPSGSDQIMFDTSMIIPPKDGFTLLPTPLGWIIV